MAHRRWRPRFAAEKIVTVSASTTPDIGKAQDPYRWANAADDTAAIPLTAAFVGRSLADEKAQWAGDEELQGKTRVFGIFYPTADTFDYEAFQPQLTKAGGPKLAAEVGFDPDNTQEAADAAAVSIAKMKDTGVTSVILFVPTRWSERSRPWRSSRTTTARVFTGTATRTTTGSPGPTCRTR